MQIELNQVSKSYGAEKALKGVSLRIEEGRALVLIGPSGGGKSTLLRLLGGLEVPDAGTLAINGESLPVDDRALQAYRRANGYLFQAFNLFPHMSLLRNAVLPLVVVHRWEEAKAVERAEECLERLGLGGRGRRALGSFPGGNNSVERLREPIVRRGHSC